MGSFRPSGKLQQWHAQEIALVVVAAANLIFLPWAYGGMVLWAQAVSLGLSVLAFVVAAWPRNYTERHTGSERFRLYPAPKLLRFPVFYLGLVYFAFVGVQLANPAWVYVERSGGWWLESQHHLAWLPHGIAGTPFQRMDAWRMLILHGSAWLLVCALWIGITRRKSAQALLMAIALNGTLLALVLLLQRLTHAKEMLWFWPAPSDYFVATFVYKNHGGAFWVMILMLCLGFAWWHADRAEQRMSKSNPSLAWLFLSLVTLVGLLLTFARASTALGLTAAVAVAIGYVIHLSFAGRGGTPAPVAGLSALVIGGFLAVCLSLIDTDKIFKKFERLTNEDLRSSVIARQLATRATWDMAQDSLAWGHGVGGYRYLFPAYQQKYPEIFTEKAWLNKKLVTRRVYWEHAHNDYVEWVAEAGLFGVGLLVAAGATVLAAARRFRLFSRPSLIVILAGPCLVMLAAAVDFPAHCPAILLTAAAIMPLGLRWSEIEARRKR